MKKCARCSKEISSNEKIVSDPCCVKPDCTNKNDVSHFKCLPSYLQIG